MHLRNEDLARIGLDKEKLASKRTKMDLEVNEKGKDREERREALHVNQELDVTKFRMMMEALVKKLSQGQLLVFGLFTRKQVFL